ncbi:thiamine phosphate synthase [Halobacillus shinanisalinarum]|uniref:Thiamine phosphate synthase n=1 Tax=Halobacillus shinanisalinarum TaxID=2932258 RepID=A0ABY4GUC2_9BACI|nr:thiamine phosphate synthase [Halobacillus shinanisalinarum]UOQ91624.1 thiamine phosphate synthase [Halobacillus shinanisalinarum]
MEFHVVSNGYWPIKQFSDKIAPLYGGEVFFHIREKQKTAKEISLGIFEMRERGVAPERIVINDRADIAHCFGSGGVQLSNQSLSVTDVRHYFPSLRVGKSVHSINEAQQAENEGADYVMFGHIYSTFSKPGKEPQGLKGLADLTDSVTLPVIAIGGIKPEHASEIRRAGATGIAAISGLLDADDAVKRYQSYKKGWCSR